jgi:hypothetical protein
VLSTKKSDRVLTTKEIIKSFCEDYGYEEDYVYKIFKTVRDDILKNFAEDKPEFRVRKFGMFYSPVKLTERTLRKTRAKVKVSAKYPKFQKRHDDLKIKELKLEKRLENAKKNKKLIDNSVLRIRNPYDKTTMSIKRIKNA